MPEKSALLDIAKSKATANRLAKQVTVEQLERAIANLNGALKTLKSKEAAKAEKRRQANIKKLTAMMSDMGLSAAEVAKLADGKTPGRRKAKRPGAKKGAKVAPKYQITANGETIKWTGRGRMPVAFREFVEQGGSLDQCLIKK